MGVVIVSIVGVVISSVTSKEPVIVTLGDIPFSLSLKISTGASLFLPAVLAIANDKSPCTPSSLTLVVIASINATEPDVVMSP